MVKYKGLPAHSRAQLQVIVDVDTPYGLEGATIEAKINGVSLEVQRGTPWQGTTEFTAWTDNPYSYPVDTYGHSSGTLTLTVKVDDGNGSQWSVSSVTASIWGPSNQGPLDGTDTPPVPDDGDFNPPDDDPTPIIGYPPEDPPSGPIGGPDPEDDQDDENQVNLVVGGWAGFRTAYAWPYASPNFADIYGSTKEDPGPGIPPEDESVLIGVNDDYDEGNVDYNGDPVPDNVADVSGFNRVDWDVAPMFMTLYSTVDDENDLGTFSLSYPDDKVMLWRPNPSTAAGQPKWVQYFDDELWDVQSWENLYQDSEWESADRIPFLVEGIAPSDEAHDVEITASFTRGSPGTATDTVRFTVISSGLDVFKVSTSGSGSVNTPGSALSDQNEEDVGAYLPINNDDDNYTATTGAGASTGADKDDTGTVVGENDMLKIVLHAATGAAGDGDYYLHIPSNLRVWWNLDRSVPTGKSSGQVLNTTAIHADEETTLWIEAVGTGSNFIDLELSPDASLKILVDRIKINAFDWSGPLNVPGYGIYNYKATSTPTGGHWIDPIGTGSSIKTGSNTSDVTIQWGEGADVEIARYQANADFVWGLEVNVVKITATTGSISRVAGGAVAGPSGNQNYANVEAPGAATFASSATVQGAGSNGTRGLQFIKVGFIQVVTSTISMASFANATSRTSSTNGMTNVLDTWDGSALPWFDTTHVPTNGVWTPSSNNATNTFQVTDLPHLWIPNRHNDLPSGSLTTGVDVRWAFTMYLAVATTEARNDSDSVFTPRVQADWSVDYRGAVNGANYTPTATDAITVPTSGTFTASPTNGARVPKSVGPIFNDEIHKIIWSAAV